ATVSVRRSRYRELFSPFPGNPSRPDCAPGREQGQDFANKRLLLRNQPDSTGVPSLGLPMKTCLLVLCLIATAASSVFAETYRAPNPPRRKQPHERKPPPLAPAPLDCVIP